MEAHENGMPSVDPAPTPRQRRLLRVMANGDLAWEVVGKNYRTIYNERRRRAERVPEAVIDALVGQGWVRKVNNTNSARLDSWELTEQGREFATQPRKRTRKISAQSNVG